MGYDEISSATCTQIHFWSSIVENPGRFSVTDDEQPSTQHISRASDGLCRVQVTSNKEEALKLETNAKKQEARVIGLFF